MSALIKAHRKNFIAGFKHGKIDTHIGGAAAMRLHVRMICSKKFFRAFNCQVFSCINRNTPAVPALSGIALRILVGQYTAGSLAYRTGNSVFRGNQVDC